jgi:2-dehydropantoate 2-reductase
MRILVYGTGPLGSLFAAKLQQGGHDVSILARGQRLADLREYGIVLKDVTTKQQTVTRVNVVERLAPDDAYDLVLVVMRKNNALDILPILAANRRTPNVLFLMNNAAGPGELVKALGRERVLIGFPNSAGYREGHVVICLTGTEEDEAIVPFGEVDGRITARTREVARVLESAPGFGAEIRTDMDTWLKYHVALLMPSLAPALYMSGTDNYRLARTRDAVVLAVRAVREGFRVLRVLGLPATPSKLQIFEWIPEPILVLLFQRWIANELMEVALVKHAHAARDEVKHLVDEFLALARTTPVPTPTIDRLYPHLAPDAPLMPEGSAEIPLDWRGVWIGLGILAGALAGVIFLVSLLRGKRR